MSFTPVPPPTPQVPDIPILSYTDQAKQEAAGYKASGWWASLVAALSTIVLPLMTNTLSVIVQVVDAVLAEIVALLTKFQATGTPAFFDFLAAMVSDLLGVHMSSDGMQKAFARGGDVAAMQAAGGLLWERLATEFGATGAITPDSGVNAAKAFLGFMLAFSVREANVATMVSILPESMRFLDGIREYPIAMARNLGLGRLARRALQPLIQVLISDPMTWFLNNQYRPKLLSEALAVRSWLRGVIAEKDMERILAWQGYSADAIAAISAESVERATAADYYLLHRFGTIDKDTMLSYIQHRGTSAPIALLMATAEEWRDADTEVSAFLSLLRTQRINGYIDSQTMNAALDGLPIADSHKTWFKNLIGQQLEWPRTHVSLAELQAAYIGGVIDLSDLQSGLKRLGYADPDQDILINLTLLKLEKAQYTAAKAEWSWLKQVAAAKKKGEEPPPKPPGIT
jgi:hypothetical protein